MPSAKEEINKWAVFANFGSEYERAGITSFIDKSNAMLRKLLKIHMIYCCCKVGTLFKLICVSLFL